MLEAGSSTTINSTGSHLFKENPKAKLPLSLSATRRFAGITFGIATQLLFLYTVVYLFLFLRYGGPRQAEASWLWLDFFLAIGFALPHSILLVPAVQKRMKQFIPAACSAVFIAP